MNLKSERSPDRAKAERRKAMRGRCLASLWLLCLALVPVMVLNSVAQAQDRKIIRLKGSNAMVNLCDKIAQEFHEKRPDIAVVVAGGTTGEGFDALCEKTADIVMASRRINRKEMQLTAICGVKTEELQVAWDSVAILVNPSNGVSQLTVEQVGKLLSGEYRSWSEVGGLDKPVIVVATERYSGTAVFLRSYAMNKGYLASDAIIKNRFHNVMKEIQRKPSAIGYASLLDAQRGEKKRMVKIVHIAQDPESPAVFPSLMTMRDGTYPLLRPLFFYWKGNMAKRDVKDFVEFVKKKSDTSL
jgi:phosphate transport system substrate-binding protein